MIATLPTLLTLLVLPAQDPVVESARPELPSLRVLVPFDTSDVESLESWWHQHERELGVAARFERVLALGPEELAEDVLLLGYERGLLEDLERDGALGSPVTTIAYESWTPVFSLGSVDGQDEDVELPEIDSWESLLHQDLRGRIRLRRPTRDSTEGLILGAIASHLDLVGDGANELPRLVLASYEAGTIEGGSSSLDGIVRGLPPGSVTIAPVRTAVLARRTKVKVSFAAPREGWFAVELAVAVTADTGPELRRWLEQRFVPALAARLVDALELEPAGTLRGDAPEWQRIVAGSRRVIDRASADALRTRLVRMYEGSPPRDALPDPGTLPDLLDTLLLTLVVVAVLVFWWKTRRPRRSG